VSLCVKCGKDVPKHLARGRCSKCYQKAYRKTRLHSAKDDSNDLRRPARKAFFASLRSGISAILKQTESTLSPAEWCAKSMRLPASKSAGKNSLIDLSIMPESVEIMSFLQLPQLRRLNLAFGTQSNKSLLLQMILAYLTQVRGADAIWGLPSDAMIKSIPLERIKPILELSGIPFEVKHSSFLFAAKNTLDFVNLKVRSQLAERSSSLIIIDEIGELPDSLGFNPVADLEQRQRIHSKSGALTVIASTPRRPDGDILALCKGTRVYNVAWTCPECSGEFVPTHEDVRSLVETEKDPATIIDKHLGFIPCPHCGSVLDDSKHLQLIKTQKLRCTTPEKSFREISVRKFTLQTAFVNFSDFLAEKVKAEGDPILYPQYRSNFCADPIEPEIMTSDINNNFTRGTYLRGQQPQGCLAWAIGVDFGDNEAWVSCIAVSAKGAHQFWSERVDRNAADTGKLTRALLHCINDNPWSKSSPFVGIALDAGDNQAEILKLAAMLPLAVPTKGETRMQQGLASKLSSSGQLHLINQPFMQDMLQAALNNGSLQLPEDAHDRLIRHLRSEVKVTEQDPKTGAARHVWKKRSSSAQNHLRDATLLAFWLLHSKGLLNIRVVPSAQVQQPAPQQRTQGFGKIPIRGIGQRQRW